MTYTEPKASEPCQWCGYVHGKICPYIRAIEYHPDGRVKRVEYTTTGPAEQSLWQAIFGRDA